MRHCKNISHIRVLVTSLFSNFFSNPTQKTETATGWETKTSNAPGQSNYLLKQNQVAVTKYDLTVFVRLFQNSGKLWKFQGPGDFQRRVTSSLTVDTWVLPQAENNDKQF
jgi:hypothetical protein